MMAELSNHDWTVFALDAEVDTYVTSRICKVHNELRRERTLQAAEIERLTADVEFWKSASEAQRRKNCDECVRIAEGEMVAKLQARVAELEKFEASMRCPNCDNLRLEIGQLRRRVAELEAELVALPAADEGAVTVEGFVAPAVFTLRPEDHYTQLEVLENSDEWSAQPVTVKIWRRP